MIFSDEIIKIILSIVFGAVVGIEREIRHKPAGLRTHILVCMGATITTVVSVSFTDDPARIAAGIITGIGFLGAGTIIAAGSGNVVGLTTAASLWVVAAIGIAIGAGEFILAGVSSLLVLLILSFVYIEREIEHPKKKEEQNK
jgi:putative Mg2+ transporter-C (MgtC) family protein